MKRALIIGISGQDGTLLAQLLKSRDVTCLGLGSKGLLDSEGQLSQSGSLTDAPFVRDLVSQFSPTQVYYLAAHHHSSQDIGLAHDADLWRCSLEVQVLGLVNVLDALRHHAPAARLFYAASSHIFGSPEVSPQNEGTPLQPDNVYGQTKVYGMEACRFYRAQYGLFTSVGILYNHESCYRKEKFLSQKIIRTALAIKAGRARELTLGDLSTRVDWGYAPDYVDAMTRILDQPAPGVYVVATGEAHAVRDFVRIAFAQQGLDYAQWVKENPSIIRPKKSSLVGDSSKLRHETGWAPSVTFEQMIARLTADAQRSEAQKT